MKFVWGLVVGAILMAMVCFMMEGAADEVAMREAAIKRKYEKHIMEYQKRLTAYEAQINKCDSIGQFCRIEGKGFMLISSGRRQQTIKR